MASCDMCGRQAELVTADIERVEMKVCPNCARFGTIKKKADHHFVSPKKMHLEPTFRITDHFASILRQIRERQKLSQEDFARFLQEKESIVAKWEQGRMQPSVEVARRLEKILGVSLVIEDLDQSFEKEKPARADGFTLGDFIKVRKRV